MLTSITSYIVLLNPDSRDQTVLRHKIVHSGSTRTILTCSWGGGSAHAHTTAGGVPPRGSSVRLRGELCGAARVTAVLQPQRPIDSADQKAIHRCILTSRC